MKHRRLIVLVLFAIWCAFLSMSMYKLFLPWSGVVVTAGFLFLLIGGWLGFFNSD